MATADQRRLGLLLARSAGGCQYCRETLNAAFTLPGTI